MNSIKLSKDPEWSGKGGHLDSHFGTWGMNWKFPGCFLMPHFYFPLTWVQKTSKTWKHQWVQMKNTKSLLLSTKGWEKGDMYEIINLIIPAPLQVNTHSPVTGCGQDYRRSPVDLPCPELSDQPQKGSISAILTTETEGGLQRQRS